MNSAKRYTQLSSVTGIFEDLFEEYFKTRRAIRKISKNLHLQTVNPFLRKAIEVRIPYMDPLTLIQVHSIDNFRKNKDTNLIALILLTINGIANGMKNTG